MAKQSFRVWHLRNRYVAPNGVQPFAVDAESHDAAASQIAMELSMGGYYRVHAAAEPHAARIVRIVPVTTYQAVADDEDSPTKAGGDA